MRGGTAGGGLLSGNFRFDTGRAEPAPSQSKTSPQISQSIQAFGFVVPVLVDAKLRVVAGHGRVMACKLLGRSQVPTISLDHLSETQIRAFAIADNRLTENSEWNDRLLAEQLRELAVLDLDFDLEATGFDAERAGRARAASRHACAVGLGQLPGGARALAISPRAPSSVQAGPGSRRLARTATRSRSRRWTAEADARETFARASPLLGASRRTRELSVRYR